MISATCQSTGNKLANLPAMKLESPPCTVPNSRSVYQDDIHVFLDLFPFFFSYSFVLLASGGDLSFSRLNILIFMAAKNTTYPRTWKSRDTERTAECAVKNWTHKMAGDFRTSRDGACAMAEISCIVLMPDQDPVRSSGTVPDCDRADVNSSALLLMIY